MVFSWRCLLTLTKLLCCFNHLKTDCSAMVARFNVTEKEIKNGEVIWYNERKGYGFVKIDNAEVFLHRSTLDRFGLIRLLTGDQVSVSLATNEHGQVIQDLLTIERPANPAPPTASEPDEGEMRAVVKFFNDIRGYGFVTAEDLTEDVFVHSRVLNDCGFHSLMQGQKLLIRIDDSGRGPQVQAVRLLDD
jgi:CspA family cold shock protein